MKYLASFFAMTAMLLAGCDKDKGTDPLANGPSITWTNTAGTKTYDFSKRYNHNEVEVLIKIATASAFSGFTVDIDSDVLTSAALTGVGLSTHLDLIDPGALETALKGLGFPTGTDVTSKKSLDMNITGFMSMISMMNQPGTADFKLTVTDDAGTTVKTLKLNLVAAK